MQRGRLCPSCKEGALSFALLTIGFFLAFLVLAGQIAAHPPSDVALSYDQGNQTLTVTITHNIGSSDPARHHVQKVEIKKNGEDVIEEEYNTQASSPQVTYIYNLSAVEGDTIDVEAYCSLYGDKVAQMTVPAQRGVVPAAAARAADPEEMSQPGFGVAMGSAVIGAMYMARRD